MKISLSRLIIGWFFIVLGIILIIFSFIGNLWILFYAIPSLILGIVILLNRREDEIEKRKDLKEKVYSK